MVSVELEGMWKDVVVTYVPGIYVEVQRKETKCIGHDDRPFGWDLNRAHPTDF